MRARTAILRTCLLYTCSGTSQEGAAAAACAVAAVANPVVAAADFGGAGADSRAAGGVEAGGGPEAGALADGVTGRETGMTEGAFSSSSFDSEVAAPICARTRSLSVLAAAVLQSEEMPDSQLVLCFIPWAAGAHTAAVGASGSASTFCCFLLLRTSCMFSLREARALCCCCGWPFAAFACFGMRASQKRLKAANCFSPILLLLLLLLPLMP